MKRDPRVDAALIEVQTWCRDNHLPDVTVTVVDDDTGYPSTWETAGFGEYTAEKFLDELDLVGMIEWKHYNM